MEQPTNTKTLLTRLKETLTGKEDQNLKAQTILWDTGGIVLLLFVWLFSGPASLAIVGLSVYCFVQGAVLHIIRKLRNTLIIY